MEVGVQRPQGQKLPSASSHDRAKGAVSAKVADNNFRGGYKGSPRRHNQRPQPVGYRKPRSPRALAIRSEEPVETEIDLLRKVSKVLILYRSFP
jgi:hypothetical protein